ncbi:YbaB/EbfC family nucleoid-associated protein [Desulforhopalus sp. IMCC35007]|uniref:YbaB/EbfC family nucleoid-associated protein n=1 Tax=Desulforhopalus sp. IMCC35007 TaxID=2569543 RepID=UPI0010AE0EC5|nr:YbaB/EbfC family nucleoid-associated protein [Desulforhopalus sp. IMCC35007]TKB07157.1 YbaB/EbfC family nucleoid-associated protein [Desulforhopalus sp. IMCC35007]
MDINNIMQQAKSMQEKMAKIQEDLSKKTLTGSAGGGMVEVTVNGQGEVLKVSIEKIVIDPSEAEMLQDLIVAATNDAIRRAKELSQQELGQLTGGLNIPGLTNLMRP